jgi:hypothetical protein
MRRREFIALLGGAAAWPVAAGAQQGERVRRIGVLMNVPADDPEGQARIAAFHQGQWGWTLGRNARIDIRIGMQSLGPLLTVLGVKLIMVENLDALRRFAPRLTKRNAASVRYASGRTRKKRPKLGPKWGKLMAARRVLSQSPSERSRIAHLAAVSRWIKWRDIKEATRASAKPKPKPKAMTRQAREARLALDRKPNGGAYSNQP